MTPKAIPQTSGLLHFKRRIPITAGQIGGKLGTPALLHVPPHVTKWVDHCLSSDLCSVEPTGRGLFMLFLMRKDGQRVAEMLRELRLL